MTVLGCRVRGVRRVGGTVDIVGDGGGTAFEFVVWFVFVDDNSEDGGANVDEPTFDGIVDDDDGVPCNNHGLVTGTAVGG